MTQVIWEEGLGRWQEKVKCLKEDTKHRTFCLKQICNYIHSTIEVPVLYNWSFAFCYKNNAWDMKKGQSFLKFNF